MFRTDGEKRENGGRLIGAAEVASVYNDHVVCFACYDRIPWQPSCPRCKSHLRPERLSTIGGWVAQCKECSAWLGFSLSASARREERGSGPLIWPNKGVRST